MKLRASSEHTAIPWNTTSNATTGIADSYCSAVALQKYFRPSSLGSAGSFEKVPLQLALIAKNNDERCREGSFEIGSPAYRGPPRRWTVGK